MRATGIVRKLDVLGRIVIPKEIRDNMPAGIGQGFEIFVDDDVITLKKYSPDCIFCGSMDELVTYKNKKVCQKCINDI